MLGRTNLNQKKSRIYPTYSFAVVDIKATEKCQKFINLNFAPIFVHGEIDLSMVPDWMKVDERTFPRKSLLQKMNGICIFIVGSLNIF